ncbi:MAG: right-handed parallel beta-helix repeat-containing protein [Lentisphaeria bacterium]|nr:right-handed parallel beta-helix repeat-containing protein [Lentisphaeria bacterium]
MQIQVTEKTGAAIQNAINQAAAAGGGKVILGSGIYPSGTIYLRSNVELHLEAGAVILGSPDWQAYDDFIHPEQPVTPENSRKCLIACADCENIAITGSGEINGQGPMFFDRNVPEGKKFFDKPPHPRPRMIQFFNCRNVRLEGVSFVNSPGWTMWLSECSDVHIERIRIIGCQQMINNDGIDIDSCRNVTVSNSFFQTGDDCLILRAIRRKDDTPAICENVLVSNCVLNSPCQGIRIGCPSDDTIRHCQFNDLILHCQGNGILSVQPTRYLRKNCTGYVNIHNLAFRNFDIECGGRPIFIQCGDGITVRGIRDIVFANIRVKAQKPFLLSGNAGSVLENIELSNISGTVAGEIPMELQYVRHLKLDQVDLTAEIGEKKPLIRTNKSSWETQF